jgi:hypothetical protein
MLRRFGLSNVGTYILAAFLMISLVSLVLIISGANLSQPMAALTMSRGRSGDESDLLYAAEPPASGVFDGEFSDGTVGQQQVQNNTETIERLVIRNATLTLVVDDPAAMMDMISSMTSEFGGWVVSANSSRTTATNADEEPRITSATINIRIPADRLDEALELIKGDGNTNTVEYENVTGQDVTQQYIDIQSRLTNLEAAEAQLQEIMELARSTEDVLAVYSELVRIRGEIESARGQIQYYEQSAAYSSVNITLRPTPIVQPVTIGGWQPLETARDAFQSFVNVLQGLADFGITVVAFVLPLLIVIGIPAWAIRRFVRRSRRSAAAQ